MADKGKAVDTLAEWMARAPQMDPDLGSQLALERARAALLGRNPHQLHLGRFEVARELGRGAMGTVYLAFDPKLEREVALKVVRFADEMMGEHVLAEARALARLDHPNVVAVFDADAQDDQVVIAMELVRGETLRTWLGKPRGLRELVRLFMELGSGLAAAHEAGVVHGDFKPDNVLVDEDGRARIVDFGLARPSKATDGAEGAHDSVALRQPVGGTPAYMAPELHTGAVPSPKTDVYAFAMSLAEALLGQRPEESPPRFSKLPRWLQDVLRRGLEVDPARRYDRMEALLEGLASGLRRQRRVVIALSATAVALVVGLGMFAVGVHISGEDDPCTRSSARFDGLWSAGRRAALADGLAGRPSGQVDHLLRGLDARAEGLRIEQSTACEATLVRREQSPELFDRQMFCLNGKAAELEAVITEIESKGVLELAQTALSTHGPASDCRASESLVDLQPPPTSERAQAQIDAIEARLARKIVLLTAGKAEAALAETMAAVAEADVLGYEPLRAKAQLAHGDTLEMLERFEEARTAASLARDAAASGGDDVRFMHALLRLAKIAAQHFDRLEEGEAYLETARSLVRANKTAADLRARVHQVGAHVAGVRKDDDRVAREIESALALLPAIEDVDKRREVEVAALSERAALQFRSNKLVEAEDTYRRIFEIKVEMLGPEHSELAKTLGNLAAVQIKANELESARASLSRARELLNGPEASHAQNARVLGLEGLVLARLGRHEEAVASYRQALTLEIDLYGADHRSVWSTKNNLANASLALERWREASTIYRERLDWASRHFGEEHTETVTARLNLANATVKAAKEPEELESALELVEQSIAALPKDDTRHGNALAVQGSALFGLDRFAESAAAYERALAAANAQPHASNSWRAYLGGQSATALWRTGRKQQALERARAALALYQELPDKAEAAAELADWIAERDDG